MVLTSRDIGIPFVIGLMINIFFVYLFSLKIISMITLFLILGGFLISIIIIGIQLKTNEIKDELDNQSKIEAILNGKKK